MRQVYFDPFGNYVQGFDQGAARQQSIESGVRTARAQDFDYNMLAPYRLNEARRADMLGEAALPYQTRALGTNEQRANNALFNENYGINQTLGRDFGVVQPLIQQMLDRYGLTQQVDQFTTDQTGRMVPDVSFRNNVGDVYGRMVDPRENILRSLNNPQALEMFKLFQNVMMDQQRAQQSRDWYNLQSGYANNPSSKGGASGQPVSPF